MNVSWLQLIPCQCSNLVLRTDCRKSFFGVFSWYLELPTSEWCVLWFIGTVRGNPMNLASMNMLRLRLIPCQFLNLVVRTDCRKSFFGVFSWYLKLLTSERRVLGVVGNIRWNPTNLCSTNVSWLRLIPCQFSNLVIMTDCRKSFFNVFSWYLELPTS